jgi:AmmeMemoRadiSam system protein B
MRIRQPAVAGTFYPDDAAALAAAVERLLETGRQRLGRAADAPAPKAIIAPHAGYVYSGPVAAAAYARLRSRTSHRDSGLRGGRRRSRHRDEDGGDHGNGRAQLHHSSV